MAYRFSRGAIFRCRGCLTPASTYAGLTSLSKDMFTGLIEAVGELVEVKGVSAGTRLRVQTPLAKALRPGDSLAVNGVCLTVIMAEEAEVHAEVGPETSRITSLGMMRRGQKVNLERSMPADGRF